MLLKKLAVSIIIIGTLIISGCGGKAVDDKSSSVEEKHLSAQDILSSVDSKNMDTTLFLGDEPFDKNCEKMYGVDTSQLSDAGISYNSEGGLADEITVLKFSDDTDGENLLQKRVFVRLNTYKSYKPSEVEKINSAEIFKKDDFYILVISDSATQIKDFILDL